MNIIFNCKYLWFQLSELLFEKDYKITNSFVGSMSVYLKNQSNMRERERGENWVIHLLAKGCDQNLCLEMLPRWKNKVLWKFATKLRMSLATQQAMDRMPSTVSMPIGSILHALKTNQIVEFVKDCPHMHCKKKQSTISLEMCLLLCCGLWLFTEIMLNLYVTLFMSLKKTFGLKIPYTWFYY